MAPSVRKLRLSVQTKVLIPVLGFLVLLPVIMVWIVNSQITRLVQEKAQGTLSTADNVFIHALDTRAGDLREHLQGSLNEARLSGLKRLLADSSAVSANTINIALRDQIAAYGPDCDAIVFHFDRTAPAAGYRQASATFDLDHFTQATRTIWSHALQGEPTIGSVSIGQTVLLVASVPVTDDTVPGKIGALTVGVHIAETRVQELRRLINTEILLVANGRTIVSTLPVSHENAQTILGSAADGHDVVVRGDHFLPLTGSYGQGADPELGFRYVLLSDYEPTLRQLEETRRTLMLVSFVGILLSGLAVWFFVRRFTQPLRELRDSAEAVGRGDFSRRIGRFSNDECGDLADAFNRMTTNLEVSHAELEKAVVIVKNTQAQLIQSEKLSAVGQFVAGVAHELNNPLTAVIGFSDLLCQTGADSKIRPHLELIAKSAHRCHKIVQNLLSFARQHPPERKLIQVNGTIEEVLEIMAYDFRTSNIKIVRDFGEDLPSTMADPHQLQQVFVNILGNARQAIQAFRPDGRITVSTRAEGRFIRIEFADNGPGIRPENLSRIFDPFFTTKPVGKGTGLGLSLTYGIVQEHRGNIRAESKLGDGATFIIELPIARDGPRLHDEAKRVVAPRPRAAGPSGKSVLVVDDEEWIQILARELLEADGHAVETASSGEEAVEALGRGKFDVIVSDWKMPGMNGIQFYDHLLATNPAMAERVLFMSGDVIDESFQEFLRQHGKICLPKPFPIEEFQDAVARMLAGRR